MTEFLCQVDGCSAPVKAREMCGKHWQRWRAITPVLPAKPRKWSATCIMDDCEKPTKSRGMCNSHYRQWSQSLLPPKPPYVRPIIPAEERFWSKVDQRGLDECWPWKAGRSKAGYGLFKPHPRIRTSTAHRYVYHLTYGAIPHGMWIDHLCHNGTDCLGGDNCQHRACCNPAHLEAVPPWENSRRSHRHNGSKTHCPQGHEYTSENTRLLADKGRAGHRECRTCYPRRYAGRT